MFQHYDTVQYLQNELQFHDVLPLTKYMIIDGFKVIWEFIIQYQKEFQKKRMLACPSLYTLLKYHRHGIKPASQRQTTDFKCYNHTRSCTRPEKSTKPFHQHYVTYMHYRFYWRLIVGNYKVTNDCTERRWIAHRQQPSYNQRDRNLYR